MKTRPSKKELEALPESWRPMTPTHTGMQTGRKELESSHDALLEALKDCLRMTESGLFPATLYEQWMPVIENMRDAIAQAEGKVTP